MKYYTGGISGFRGFAVEPSGLAPPGFNPGRKDFTVADVLAWARTKPSDGRYRYSDPNNCALCQFLKETKRAARPGVMPHVGGFPEFGYWDDDDSARHNPYPAQLEPALEARGGKLTFGALVTRLEKLCPETPLTKSDWLAIDAYMVAEQVEA